MREPLCVWWILRKYVENNQFYRLTDAQGMPSSVGGRVWVGVIVTGVHVGTSRVEVYRFAAVYENTYTGFGLGLGLFGGGLFGCFIMVNIIV